MERRQFITTCGAALCVAMFATTATAEPLFVVDTNDGYLNLRAGPGTQHAIIARLYGGTEVDGIGQSGSWRRIALPDGRTGWAAGNFMTPRYVRQRQYDAVVARTNDGYLNLRTGPGTNYRINLRLYAGQGVIVIGAQGNWLRIRLPDGTAGWTSSRYLN